MSETRDMERGRCCTALVTGASSGIGREVALALLADGLRVAICARRRERLDELVAASAAPAERVLALAVDLRQEEQIQALFSAIRQRWGGVDVLVNNAGLGHAEPLVSGDTERWREMLEVNVLALCIATREAIADMRRRDAAGHVVHISSMAAHRVPPGSAVYSATKYAVRSLTEGLRQELRELGSPIRVSAVSPGFVETEFAEHYHKSAEAARTTYSRYKVLEADDIARAVVYLLDQPAHVQIHDLLVRPTDQRS
jgi:NADP-dependent 3-hydroxy acid dehydrogenase YdfG